mmetsp:Transcript_47851/g.77200  ORF Transcript_47851/g.77200 Transcript_47851/m.77200 type:complete len:136 (-) Transcript_47851:868-1275(-)
MMQGTSSTSQASDQRCCRRSVSRLPVRAGCGRLNDRLFFLMFAMNHGARRSDKRPWLASFKNSSTSTPTNPIRNRNRKGKRKGMAKRKGKGMRLVSHGATCTPRLVCYARQCAMDVSVLWTLRVLRTLRVHLFVS